MFGKSLSEPNIGYAVLGTVGGWLLLVDSPFLRTLQSSLTQYLRIPTRWRNAENLQNPATLRDTAAGTRYGKLQKG
jgi:hypothetical protein